MITEKQKEIVRHAEFLENELAEIRGLIDSATGASKTEMSISTEYDPRLAVYERKYVIIGNASARAAIMVIMEAEKARLENELQALTLGD